MQAAQQAMPSGLVLPSIPLYVPFGRRWDLLSNGVIPKHDGPTADNAAVRRPPPAPAQTAHVTRRTVNDVQLES